jgi:hypothetical protein
MMDMKRKMDAASKMVEVMDMIAGDRIQEQLGGEKPEEANEIEGSGEMSEGMEEGCEPMSPVDAAKKPEAKGVAVEIEIEKKKKPFSFGRPEIERS